VHREAAAPAERVYGGLLVQSMPPSAIVRTESGPVVSRAAAFSLSARLCSMLIRAVLVTRYVFVKNADHHSDVLAFEPDARSSMLS
jgi:hypothetical protein